MSKKQVIEKSLPVPLSQAIRAGDFVFVSGTVPFDDKGLVVEGSIEEQTRVVLRTIERLLRKAGVSLEDVVKTTCWLEDPRDFGRFNRVYEEFFPKDPPTRSTVRADLMIDVKVEIEALAYAPAR
ncbi:MAG: RidA family protein [Alphaproteobacteria bacterium]|nr:RidA family protein [Alphaproteobacteria bacterium]